MQQKIRLCFLEAFVFFLCFPTFFSFPQGSEQQVTIEAPTTVQAEYRVRSIIFQIKGRTKERILRNKAQIDIGARFATPEDLARYIADARQRLLNERVLQSVEIEYLIETLDENHYEVDIVIAVEDSWNIIALPYFRYDSNDGLLLSIRARDYDFLGSMQALVLNIDYSSDTSGAKSYGAYTSFSVPLQIWAHDAGIDASEMLEVYANKRPMTSISDISFWYRQDIAGIPFTLRASQGLQFNPDGIANDPDPYFLRSALSVASTVSTGVVVPGVGELQYAPSLSLYELWRPNAPVLSDRQGATVSFSHSISGGRVDWIGNMRSGLLFSVSNTDSYNLYRRDPGADIDFLINFHAMYKSIIGANARGTGFYSFTSDAREKLGSSMRGILDSRLYGTSAVFLSVEVPIKLFDFPTHVFIKKDWLDFELQCAPFLDLGYVEGAAGTVAATYHDWYSGGIELLVYPFRMRTFIVRASLGFDLNAVLTTHSLTASSPRDGASPYELFIGIGLFF